MSVKNIQYLSRIVDFLVDDTEISEGDKKIIDTPFGVLGWEYFLRNQRTPIIYFVEYIENTYGITQSESRYIWDRYVSKLKDKRYDGNKETISENFTSHHQWMMGNPSDFLKFEGISVDLKQKLIKIIYQTVDSILESMTYSVDNDDSTNQELIIRINNFENIYGMYLENDGTVGSFKKFCDTYMNYILKEMMTIFRDYTDRNPSLIANFGLGSTVLLMNKMGEIFINE
jgi:hypothetical protein